MKRLIFVLFVSAIAFAGWLALPTIGSPSEAISPQDRAAIEGVIANQQKDWNEGNVDAFLKGYWHSEELTFSGSQGISRGWDGVRERYNEGYPDRQSMGKLDFSGLEFRSLGPNSALVLGQWHLTREKGNVGGVFSLVFQSFPEGWKISHDHTSVVPQSVSR